MISEENKKILFKRLESLVWRAGGMLLALLLAFISENIGLLAIPNFAKIVVGLIIAEISKYYNVDIPRLQGSKPKIEIFDL